MRNDVPWCPGTGQPADEPIDTRWSSVRRPRGHCPHCHREISLSRAHRLLPHCTNLRSNHTAEPDPMDEAEADYRNDVARDVGGSV